MPDKKDFVKLEKSLGITFRNINFLKQALTHRSYLNENPEWVLGHNERLEFLGDAVLELATSYWMYDKYPESPEGLLTSLRASLVNASHLSQVAQGLNLEDYLLLSKGGAKDNSRSKTTLSSNAVEAIIGAIYLDQGFEKASKFVEKFILKDADQILKTKAFKDAKSKLQEVAQDKLGVTPTYKTLDSWGPDHDKHFIVGVHLGEELLAQGEGISKQEAEQSAAESGLRIKGWHEN